MAFSTRGKMPAFFALSFLIGIPRLFTLTVSDSLFLSHYPAAQIPLAYLGRALLIPLLGWLLFQAERSLSNRRVLNVLLLLLSLTLVGFLVVFRLTDWTWPYLALLIWVSAEWTLSGMVFWNTANRHFTLREGKRAFGLISTGEVVAAILGGFLVPVLLRWMAPLDLLWLSIGGHLLALALLAAIGEATPSGNLERSHGRARPHRRLKVVDLLRSPYVLGLFGLTSLDFLVHYVTDNAFFLRVQIAFPDNAGLTAFLGAFLGVLGVATLGFKLLVTTPLIQKLGLGRALALGPLAIGVLGVAVFLSASVPGALSSLLPLLIAAKFVQMLYSEALFSPVYYLLFQPLPPGERTRIQNFAEAVPGRLVAGAGGLVLLLAGGLGPHVVGWLGYALGLLALVWWLAIRHTAGNYWKLLQTATEDRTLPGLAPSEAGRPLPADFEAALARVELWSRLTAAWARDERRADAPWLDQILKEESDLCVGDVLSVLQRELPSEPFAGLRAALASDSPALRSYALESLENLLEPSRRERLIPLLERGEGPRVLERRAFARLVREAPLGAFRPLFQALVGPGDGPLPGDDDLVFLKSVPLFHEVPYWYLPLVLAEAEELAFGAGTAILRQGESGDTLYLVRRGQVRVHDGERTLATMGAGGLFGEYAVFDPSPRTASVTGLGEGATLRLSGTSLVPLLHRHAPVLAGIVKILGLRLYERPHWLVCEPSELSGALSVAQLPSFAGLSGAANEALARWGRVEHVAAGEAWFAPGDLSPGLTFVLSGAMEWEGVRLGPGAVVDDVSAVAQQPCRGWCRAAAPTTLFVLEPSLFLQSLTARPEALAAYLRDLVRRLKRVRDL